MRRFPLHLLCSIKHSCSHFLSVVTYTPLPALLALCTDSSLFHFSFNGHCTQKFLLGFNEWIITTHISLHSSYLLQLSTPSSHKHNRVFSIGVRSYGAHALSAVLINRVSLDDTQASQWLVQHQTTKIVTNLFRLRTREEGVVNRL